MGGPGSGRRNVAPGPGMSPPGSGYASPSMEDDPFFDSASTAGAPYPESDGENSVLHDASSSHGSNVGRGKGNSKSKSTTTSSSASGQEGPGRSDFFVPPCPYPEPPQQERPHHPDNLMMFVSNERNILEYTANELRI